VISLRAIVPPSRHRLRPDAVVSSNCADRRRAWCELARTAHASTEQTRDWEKGERSRVLSGVRSYSKWAAALMVVTVPVFFIAMPWLVEVVFGTEYDGAVDAARIVLLAAAIQFAIGWTKSLPVTIGCRLRRLTGSRRSSHPRRGLQPNGATGAAVAVPVRRSPAAAWLVRSCGFATRCAAEPGGEMSLQP
jgi:hypothetical protein